ncbi:hypothetical protein [Schauerella aestuarii]|uniref:hypothetical protein n=1 Tax=Schauerella aestuarii TaxID=2511204 RepID=UPI001926955E|nr:hypothetical protein [Achromobacter aestuarii]MYZ45916.1 hypothetical protein [Achromobacter aestuarii]
MQWFHRRAVPLAFIAVLSMGLTACGGDDDNDAPPAPPAVPGNPGTPVDPPTTPGDPTPPPTPPERQLQCAP